MSNENLGGIVEPTVDVQPKVSTAEAKKIPWYHKFPKLRKFLMGVGVAAVASTTAVDAHAHSPITQENSGSHTITATIPNDGPPKPTPSPDAPLELVTSHTTVTGHAVDSDTTVTQVSPSAPESVTAESSTPTEPVSTPEPTPGSGAVVDPTTAMEAAQAEQMQRRAAEILAKVPVSKEVRNENGVMITVLTVTKDGLQSLTLTACTKVTITRDGAVILEQALPAEETTIDIADTVEIGDKIEVKGDEHGNGTIEYQSKTPPAQ